jgi:hypothetical protein
MTALIRSFEVIVLVCLVRRGLSAEPSFDTNSLTIVLERVPAAELPAMSAALVKASVPQHRCALATNVVRVAVRIHAAAAAAIVGAVARVAPETTAVVSSTAAAEQPECAAAIVRAAIGAVPDRAVEVITHVCAVTPNDYHIVALAAEQAIPSARKDILRAIGVAIVDLKSYIDAELSKYRQETVPSVDYCLERAELARIRASSSDRTGMGAAVPQGRPVIPPGQGGPKPPKGNADPPGGRNYARP